MPDPTNPFQQFLLKQAFSHTSSGIPDKWAQRYFIMIACELCYIIQCLGADDDTYCLCLHLCFLSAINYISILFLAWWMAYNFPWLCVRACKSLFVIVVPTACQPELYYLWLMCINTFQRFSRTFLEKKKIELSSLSSSIHPLSNPSHYECNRSLTMLHRWYILYSYYVQMHCVCNPNWIIVYFVASITITTAFLRLSPLFCCCTNDNLHISLF